MARLRALMAEGHVTVRIETQSLTEWRPIPLLTAQLPGAPETPYVLLSSHVDSWYYGAMDNGGANATTLEVARNLAEQRGSLRRGLRVASWSGHSHGRFAHQSFYGIGLNSIFGTLSEQDALKNADTVIRVGATWAEL